MILEYGKDLAEGIRRALDSNDLEFILCRTISEAKTMLRQTKT